MDLKQEIDALERDHRQAFVARDLERLGELWSDDLLVNSPINRVQTKRQVLDLLRSGTIAHVSFEADLEVVERHGDLVRVLGGESIVNQEGGPVLRRRFTNLWRPEGGVLRLWLRHANLVP